MSSGEEEDGDNQVATTDKQSMASSLLKVATDRESLVFSINCKSKWYQFNVQKCFLCIFNITQNQISILVETSGSLDSKMLKDYWK